MSRFLPVLLYLSWKVVPSASNRVVGNFSEVFIFAFFVSQEPFAKIKTAKISEIRILAYFVKILPARGHQCCARDYSDQDCTVL